MYRCDACDQLEAITGNRRWQTNRLTVRDAGVRYARASFREALEDFAETCRRYSKLELSLVESSANVVCRFRRIDGTNGVLARMQLPGMPSYDHEQINGEWDNSERPTQVTLTETTRHEGFHALGIIHYNSEPSLMNATLTTEFAGTLDDWTREELQSRHGTNHTTVPVPDCGTWLDTLCAGLWQVPR